MFIRFKRVKLARKTGVTDEYSLHAVLVESYRRNGKPRQQIIAYLGSIQEKHLQNQMHRKQFFDLLQKGLQDLGLSPHVLTKVQLNLINTFSHKILRQNHRTV